MTNQKLLDKNKTKELDWEEDFCGQVRFYCGVDLDYETELKPLIKTVSSLLQKQRTELLEEILEQNKDDMTGLYDYDGIAETVINLFNKKDE